MKVQNFICDRCGDEFNKEVGKEQSTLAIKDRDLAWDSELETKDLCEDCVASYYDWMNHNVEVDKFIDSKQKEWEKEEESE